MTELTERDKIIKQVYENVETGYGSVKTSLEQAKKMNSLKPSAAWPLKVSRKSEGCHILTAIRRPRKTRRGG